MLYLAEEPLPQEGVRALDRRLLGTEQLMSSQIHPSQKVLLHVSVA